MHCALRTDRWRDCQRNRRLEFIAVRWRGTTTFVECVSASYMDTCRPTFGLRRAARLYARWPWSGTKDADTIVAFCAQKSRNCGVLRMLRNDTSASMNQILLINAAMKD